MIFDIKKFAIHDGPGIRTTVFFALCPLDCWWCHNPECKSDGPGLFPELKPRELPLKILNEIQKDIIFYDQSGGGVTFSGGEPLGQVDLLEELLSACRKLGIHTAVDTCGHADFENFEMILGSVSLFLYDLKLIDEEAHMKYTGVSTEQILENLGKLVDSGANVHIRIPLIPGITDTEANLAAIAELAVSFSNIPSIVLLPFNLFGQSKYKKLKLDNRLGDLQAQSEEELKAMCQLIESHGVVCTC